MRDEQLAAYPIAENLHYVHEQTIYEYFRLLFSSVRWDNNKFLCLRGIGEKGTPKEGVFREDAFLQPSLGDVRNAILKICQRYAQHHVAAFCIPAVLKSARGKADQVELFTSVLCDLDTGDTDEKLAYLVKNVGEPTMVIASGGTTPEGKNKRHVYYCLNEPTDDIALIVVLRDMIARKVGSDPMMGLGVASNPYGRAHQPIRIAGTCHAKVGVAKGCFIESRGSHMQLDRLCKSLDIMEIAEWVEQIPASIEKNSVTVAGGFEKLFSPQNGNDISNSLLQPVHEGGTDRTRFSEFNRVAGHHIRQIRNGKMTAEEARQATFDWVAAMMVPPWPDNRVQQEFQALLNKDGATSQVQFGDLKFNRPKLELNGDAHSLPKIELAEWAAHRWAVDPKPTHEFLVEKLIITGEPHIFVSEGGAGKTFQVADLAMKVASHCNYTTPSKWCGQKIMAGGTAVLLLCEDSKREMHIRLMDIDRGGLIKKAGDKLIVIPMTAVGGAFSLVSKRQDGTTTSSPQWNDMLKKLKKIPDLKLVAIDTFNSMSHGDENSAMAVAEMMREAHRVCGETGAALLFNHHVRKQQNSKDNITSMTQLSQGIRGSSAIPSYFRICLGMFHATDYRRRMNAMGVQPENKALWRFGILKANIQGLMRGEKTLLRNKVGLLEDVSARDKYNVMNIPERAAWLVFAIKIAAEARHPYAVGVKSRGAVFTRRAELPELLRKSSEYELKALIEDAQQNDRIIQCAAKGGKSKGYYDVMGGPIASDYIGAELNSGAYVVPMDFWDDYDYDAIEGIIVQKREMRNPFDDKAMPLAPLKSAAVPVKEESR